MERKLEYKMSVSGAKESQAQLDSVKGSVSSINDTFIKTVTAVAGATVAIKGLVSFYNDFVVQRNAVIGLDRAIEGLGSNTTVTSEMIQKLATQLQGVSDIGDELSIKEIFTPLINSGVQAEDVLKNLSTTISDTVAGTGNSVSAVTALFTRAINGNSQSLKTLAEVYKVSSKDIEARLEGVTDATERAKILTEALGGVYSGLGKALSNPLTRLENALGDLKESIGKAFAPMVEGLANSATAWVSNQKNVENLIRAIKIASASMVAFAGIKLTKNISSGLQSIAKEYDLIGRASWRASKAQGRYDRSLSRYTERINAIKNSTGSLAIQTARLAKQESIMNTRTITLNDSLVECNSTAKTSVKNIGALSVGLLGWIGIAISAVSIGYQIGKSFGWWGKSIKDTTDKLEEQKKKELDRRNVFNASLQSAKELLEINNRTVAENKELSTILGTLKSDYGIVVGLEEDRGKALKIINEELDTQKSFNSAETTKKRLTEEKKALEQQIKASNTIISKYKDVEIYAQSTGDAIKGWFIGVSGIKSLTKQGSIIVANKKIIEDSLAEIEELDKQINNLGKGSNNLTDSKLKDISALSKYYDMVKFGDSSYFSWRQNLNKQEAEEYELLLRDKGFTDAEALDMKQKYYSESNSKLLEEQRSWVAEMERISESYRPKMEHEVDNEPFDWGTPKVIDNSQALASYHDTMVSAQKGYSIAEQGMLRLANLFGANHKMMSDEDKAYFDYKKQLIEDDVNAQLEAGLLTQEQADLLRKKRMEDLLMESEAYQNYYAVVSAGIEGAMGSMLEFAKVTAKSNNDIAKAWYALANAVIAQLKRMVTQMIVNFIWQQILGFMTGGTSKVVPKFGGNGIGLNTPGVGFLSTPTSPIGSGSSNITPNVNTNRSNDDGIINKLNEVINAINVNSIRGKLRIIDRIELAQEVEAGNLQRSVK